MSAQQLTQDIRKLQHIFSAPWDMGDEDNALAHCCQAFELAKVLPPGTATAQMQPLCRELVTVAKSLCALEPLLWQRLGATRDGDVAGLKRVLSQASAGAYLASICLYTGLCDSPAALKEDLLFHLGKATAIGFRTALGATERLAAALPTMTGTAGSATSAMLRGRVPFLLGMLVRPAALITQTPAGAPAARGLQKLRRSAWSPQVLLEGQLVGSRAAAALLRSGPPGGNWALHLASIQVSLSMAAELGKPASQRVLHPANIPQQRVLNTPLLLAVEQLAAGMAQGGSGGWNREATASAMWQLAWQQALKALPLVMHCPDTEHFTAEESSNLSQAASQAVAAFTAACASLPHGAALPAWAVGAAAGAVELATSACDALFRANMPADLGLVCPSAVHRGMVQALLLAEAQLPATLQLLRTLLLGCAAGSRGGRGSGGSAGVDSQGAQRLLSAVAVVVTHFQGLRLAELADVAPALVVVPAHASEPSQSAGQGLATLASLADSALRCLGDLAALEAGTACLLRAAGPGASIVQRAHSYDLISHLEHAACFCLAAVTNVLTMGGAIPDAPSLASARTACFSLAHTACKLTRLAAVGGPLLCTLQERGGVEVKFWVCGAAATAMEMVLKVPWPVEAPLQEGPDRREGPGDLQACALAALAALRASLPVPDADGWQPHSGVYDEEGAEGGLAADVDSKFVECMCLLLDDPSLCGLLMAEGVAADVAAAAVRLLGRRSIEKDAARRLVNACSDAYGLALSIAAQPGFAELASTPAEGGFAMSPQHSDIVHAVAKSVVTYLDDDKSRQLGVANGAIRAAELPTLRRQKLLLMSQLAAAQLAEQPVVPPAGSDEAKELGVERALALGACPGCASLACTNLAGASEAAIKTRKCSRCRVLRFCCDACNKAEWRRHKRSCGALAAARAL